jgi:hypothetical protein
MDAAVIRLLDELAFAVADRSELFKLAHNPEMPLAHQAVYLEGWEVAQRESEALVALIRDAQTMNRRA